MLILVGVSTLLDRNDWARFCLLLRLKLVNDEDFETYAFGTTFDDDELADCIDTIDEDLGISEPTGVGE